MLEGTPLQIVSFIMSIKKRLKSFLYKKKFPTCTLSDEVVIYSNAACSNSSFLEHSRIGKNTKIGHSSVGRFSSIGPNCTITHTKIGAFCSISWNVTINARNHDYSHITTHAFPYVKRFGIVKKDTISYNEVIIGNDVWIGTGTIILPGVTIGNGAVIGAGSVVTKNIEEYSIYAGNPARKIRDRFDTEVINQITASEWWNWNIEEIKSKIRLFKEPRVKSNV